MNLFVTVPIQKQAFDGAIKPKEDVAHFLHKIDFQTIGILRYDWKQHDWNHVRFRIAGSCDQVRQGDVVIHQFPTYLGYRYENEFISRLKVKGAKVIGMIHDVDYLRSEQATNKKGILQALQQMDLLILTSEKLKHLLRQEGCQMPVVVRGPWDYQTTVQGAPKKFAKTITVAGHLADTHTGYLEALSGEVSTTVFGKMYKGFQMPENVLYQGAVDGSLLPVRFESGFGLVWNSDGKRETPYGIYGEYMSYTWLHKFSLYISSGLPVIVPSGTPMAEFVKKHQLGFVIDELSEVKSHLESCTEEMYLHFCKQTAFIGDLMHRGYFTMEAVIQALQKLNEAS